MMRAFFKPMAAIMVVMILFSPLQLLAQRSRQPGDEGMFDKAKTDAEADAERETSKAQWLACGCIGVYFGVAAAYLMVSEASEDRLLGKPPGYVMVYTTAYRNKKRSIQTRYAMIGCATTTVLATIGMIWYLSSEEANCCNDEDFTCGPEINCGSSDGCSDSESDGCSSGSNCSGE